MDLVVFENNKPYVIDEFREGRFDYIELASDVAETKFFQFPAERDRCQWRRCYKVVFLPHCDRPGERFVVAGLKVLRDNQAEGPALWEPVDTFVEAVGPQGKRTLNPCQAKDLRQVVRIPAGLSTSHGDAFFVFDLLQ